MSYVVDFFYNIFDFIKKLFLHLDSYNISIFTILIFINIIIAFTIVFIEYQTASSSWAWILVLFFLPYIGLLLYLILGRPIYRQKIFPYTPDEKIAFQQKILKRTYPYAITKEEKIIYKHKNLIELNYETDQAFLSKNNTLDIIIDGHEKFEMLFRDIKRAKKYIHIQYYILKNDGIGKELFSLLYKKLKEGVKVCILYDDIGSRSLNLGSLNFLIREGAEVKRFFKSRFALINFRMNYRNHRKVVVIDGEIGYTGGFNVGDEYLGKNKKFGYWRDTHLRIKGAAASSLNFRFIDDWNSQVIEDNKTNVIKLEEDFLYNGFKGNNIPIQVVSSGPDSKLQKIKYSYLHMINSAKKYIFIQSPYFIPDESVMDALRLAILSGIDVRIMVPNKPDHPLVYWATYSYVSDLLEIGAKIYIYENGFIHTKMIIIDDEVTSIGSANFDYRSFKLNFEMNAFIYHEETTKTFRKIFYNDTKKSTQMTFEKYLKRSLIIKIKEALARLIAPIL